jgi:hypothetical protein
MVFLSPAQWVAHSFIESGSLNLGGAGRKRLWRACPVSFCWHTGRLPQRLYRTPNPIATSRAFGPPVQRTGATRFGACKHAMGTPGSLNLGGASRKRLRQIIPPI